MTKQTVFPDNTVTYPQNLVDAVNGFDEAKEPEPMDVACALGELGTVACAMLAAHLTEREQKVIEYRYAQGLSLVDTGKKFNVTRERIRQVEAKAIRKLRRREARQILCKGVYSWMNDQIDVFAEQKARAMLEQYKAEFIDQWAKDHQEPSPLTEEERNMRTYETPVEYADLSVRAYNCLKRAGLNTVGDVVNEARKGFYWWQKCRNLGKKSYEEICRKFGERFGINLESVGGMQE